MREEPAKGVAGGPEPLVMRARDAAAFLCISERHLFSLSKKGLVKVTKIGKAVRYFRPDLIRFLQRGGCVDGQHCE